MEKDTKGYRRAFVKLSGATNYLYRLERELERPDPASHFQPEGVHGPSRVVVHNRFRWQDNNWKGIALSDMIIYEIHIGTFTREGTFTAAVPRLRDLIELGINAVEIMPVAQFPGKRNWGYDGTYPFAVQNSYGGPEGLKQLVNECHKQGIAVILDVVYNHLGPEGNYLGDFGPYFTDRYKTPWGMALNFDGPYSNEVRNLFINNAIHWFGNYHIDALRLDAIHGITDLSAYPFLLELSETVKRYSDQVGRKFYLIAESDLNDSRVVKPKETGGYGIDAQWCDDFHHSLHTILTGEKEGYYTDFGTIWHMVKSLHEGFVYSGGFSEYRKKNHGSSSAALAAEKFVVFSQNHDQIGNRMLGERLSSLVSFEALKLAAGLVLFSPYIPLLFMGEEYGEESPFLYFIDHSDKALIEAVRNGRKNEFTAFDWKGNPPDPYDTETFEISKIQRTKRKKRKHKVLLELYRTMIQLRQTVPALGNTGRDCIQVQGSDKVNVVHVKKWKDKSEVYMLLNFNNHDAELTALLNKTAWRKILDTAEDKWSGPGTLLTDWVTGGKRMAVRKQSMAVYLKKDST